MESKSTPPPVVTLVTRVDQGEQIELAELIDWLVKLLGAGFRTTGFWSGEILPPNRHESKNWTLLQRFRLQDQAEAWRDSATRQTIVAQLRDLTGGSEAKVYEEVTGDASIGSAVTAIVTYVKPGMEEHYGAWQHKIHSMQARSPGYGGVYIQPPAPGKAGQWTTLLRFDSPAALDNWFGSPERQSLLAEAEQFVADFRYHPVTSSFPGFFPGDEEGGKPTPTWKGAAMVLIGLFPLLEILRAYYTPWAASNHIRLVIALAVSTLFSVSMVSFVTMPIVVKLFNWWLAPPPGQEGTATDMKGLAIVVAIFICEILAAWPLLVQ